MTIRIHSKVLVGFACLVTSTWVNAQPVQPTQPGQPAQAPEPAVQPVPPTATQPQAPAPGAQPLPANNPPPRILLVTEEPPPPVPRAQAASATHFGLGYKIGNGLGFVGGDIIIGPFPYVAIDLQANYLSGDTNYGTATGYGLAPALQVYFLPPGRHTPFVDVGYIYATMSLQNVKASASGYFINGGYEWKWTPGFSLLLGAGVEHLGTIHATDGITTIDQTGGTHFNLEVGPRFMFF